MDRIMETALYFPYIRVPQSAWFTQILLYWDRAATIVPREIQDDRGVVGTTMNELVTGGLLEYVDPDREDLSYHGLELGEAFMTLLEQHSIVPRVGQAYTRIHTGKMGWQVFYELEQRHLAERDRGPEWDTWWRVEKSAADLYMGLLAAALSGSRRSAGDDTYPVTDSASGMATLAAAGPDLSSRLRSLRYSVIMEALPTPADQLSAHELIEFKGSHSDQLKRLRRFLDSKLVDIAAVDDIEERDIKLRLVKDEVRDEIEILKEQMSNRNWGRIILLGIGGVAAGALTVASGLLTGGASTLAVGLAAGGGLLSTAGAGVGTVEMLREARINPTAPLAYAALAPG